NTPVVRITAPANGAAFFAADGPITLTGSATDVEDGNLSGRLQWSSDRDGALAIGATILASQLSIGTHTITAMAIDDDGLHGQASISIRVRGPNQPPAVAITSPADGTSVPAGTPTARSAAARPSRPAGSRSARTRSRPPPPTGATSSVRRLSRSSSAARTFLRSSPS